MLTGIMVTRLDPEVARKPSSLEELNRPAISCVQKQCPAGEPVDSSAAPGLCDHVDIFRAEGVETATTVSTLIRRSNMRTRKFDRRPAAIDSRKLCARRPRTSDRDECGRLF